MSQLVAYDNVNPLMDNGDDEMEDEPDDIPSGPGLVNPLLMRRMSQASRGVYTISPSPLLIAEASGLLQIYDPHCYQKSKYCFILHVVITFQ